VAHAVGWPIPRGGAQAISNALASRLALLGGTVYTSSRVDRLEYVGKFDAALCDLSPAQLLRITGMRFPVGYRRQLQRYRAAPAAYKVDYALSERIPWRAAECARAVTVHLGGSLEEIAEAEDAPRRGRHAERPFVLLAQPTLFDPTRAPEGRHIAWAYCHVPNGSEFDMLPRLEAQIERFAPGFRDCILARRVLTPAALEAMDANLTGGDIMGGDSGLKQMLFRPTWRQYATPDRRIYLCSASTPPGGGVHGMCGYHGAMVALRKLGLG
jgi:phytoene dehydrogenase-like protein